MDFDVHFFSSLSLSSHSLSLSFIFTTFTVVSKFYPLSLFLKGSVRKKVPKNFKKNWIHFCQHISSNPSNFSRKKRGQCWKLFPICLWFIPFPSSLSPSSSSSFFSLLLPLFISFRTDFKTKQKSFSLSSLSSFFFLSFLLFLLLSLFSLSLSLHPLQLLERSYDGRRWEREREGNWINKMRFSLLPFQRNRYHCGEKGRERNKEQRRWKEREKLSRKWNFHPKRV